jgi:hypothetical protein
VVGAGRPAALESLRASVPPCLTPHPVSLPPWIVGDERENAQIEIGPGNKTAGDDNESKHHHAPKP